MVVQNTCLTYRVETKLFTQIKVQYDADIHIPQWSFQHSYLSLEKEIQLK